MMTTTMEVETGQRWLSFGRYRFNPDSGELLRDGRRLVLQPQPARLLALLVGQAGEVTNALARFARDGSGSFPCVTTTGSSIS